MSRAAVEPEVQGVVRYINSTLSCAAVALSCYSCPVFAQTTEVEDTEETSTLLERIHLTADLRSRYQFIDSAPGLENGEALTIRVHGTGQIDFGNQVSFLGEIEATGALIDNYNDGTGAQSGRPFVPDPDGIVLNRLKLIVETIPKTRVSLGRQRISLNDGRFLGGFTYRQNDQTIDAIRVEKRNLDFGNKTGVLDIGIFDQVNRPLGPDNIEGEFNGISWYANYGVTTPVGRIAAFHYDFSLETNLDDYSTRTTGVRLLGRRHSTKFGVVWEASYARQRNRDNNPRDLSVDYWLGRMQIEAGEWDFTVKGEKLGAEDGQALQTPLGSLHGHSGLADQFLRTPPDGLQDISFSVGREFGRLGPFERISAVATIHRFEDADGGRPYGDELDFLISTRLGESRISFEHARYDSRGFGSDTRSTVLSLSYAFGD